MFKKILGLVFLFIVLSWWLIVSFAFAQEEITFTTYYPSPYGVYREMRAQRMAIGETYINHSNVCWQGDAGCSGPAMIPTGAFDPDVDLIVQGNVGIGTTNPGVNRLRVQDDSSNSTYPFRATNRDGVNPDKILEVFTHGSGAIDTFFGLASNAVGFYTQNSDASGIGTYDNVPFILGTNNTERMRITNAGNVGIGTTGPRAKLEISDGNFFIDGNPSIWGDMSYSGGNDSLFAFNHFGNSNGKTYFRYIPDINNPGNSTVLMTIQNNGNVGIGTTSPNATKGTGGYLDAKDVWLRDANKWASQGGVTLGDSYWTNFPGPTNNRIVECASGYVVTGLEHACWNGECQYGGSWFIRIKCTKIQ